MFQRHLCQDEPRLPGLGSRTWDEAPPFPSLVLVASLK